MKKMIAFRADETLKNAFFQKANTDGISVSSLLNLLVQAYVNDQIDIGAIPGEKKNPKIFPITI